MTENDIRDFWQQHPCGASLVGDLPDESRAEYARFFERYDRYRYTKEPHILANISRLDLAGKQVLEIGLGQGADAEQMVRMGAVYSGVDLTGEAVERTRTRLELKGLPFERIEKASVLELPFGSSSFDLVFSHGVLHHVPQVEAAQREIRRVLQPEGQLVVMLYARRSLNYLLSIWLLRRAGLAGMYLLGLRGSGIYAAHLDNAREAGLISYLRMRNFINVSTDGPYNPYSRVYSMADVRRAFPAFEVVRAEKHFMHAPPLPVGWLPLASMLGWHLWVWMRPKGE